MGEDLKNFDILYKKDEDKFHLAIVEEDENNADSYNMLILNDKVWNPFEDSCDKFEDEAESGYCFELLASVKKAIKNFLLFFKYNFDIEKIKICQSTDEAILSLKIGEIALCKRKKCE